VDAEATVTTLPFLLEVLWGGKQAAVAIDGDAIVVVVRFEDDDCGAGCDADDVATVGESSESTQPISAIGVRVCWRAEATNCCIKCDRKACEALFIVPERDCEQKVSFDGNAFFHSATSVIITSNSSER
jgi:hypothetical protein